ncbi:glycosyl transferase family 1 [Synergistales bacterium]|nr:glycosyl transferase family 1 [Synergistales bacterium]
MPKLLIVTTVAATLRAFLLPYARHFRQQGWTVDAMSNGASGCPECVKSFDECYDIPFSRNPLNIQNYKIPGTGERVGAKIREVVQAGGYDIVHVHTPVAAFLTRFALRKEEKRPKIVYTAHGFHFHKAKGVSVYKNVLYAGLERIARDWTDHTIVINQEDYDMGIACKVAYRENISLFPGIGLDFSRYSRENVDVSKVRELHEELGLGKGDELFLMVGEFNLGKRHKDAIQALAGTGRANFHLALAGTGPLELRMKQLAIELGVGSRTHFLGVRDDVSLLMLSSRATVLPSEREGLSRSVMESICLGIPVLGSDTRGIRDIITSPIRGALFPVGNSAALAAAMILAVDDARQERPEPDEAWRIENLIDLHEKLYKKLLIGL